MSALLLWTRPHGGPGIGHLLSGHHNGSFGTLGYQLLYSQQAPSLASEGQDRAVTLLVPVAKSIADQGIETFGVEDPAVPPVAASSSSSPDEAVTRPANMLPPDDFWAHQELLKWVAANLGLNMEELKEQTDSLFDILAAAALSKVALLVHDWNFQLVTVLCQTPSLVPTS